MWHVFNDPALKQACAPCDLIAHILQKEGADTSWGSQHWPGIANSVTTTFACRELATLYGATRFLTSTPSLPHLDVLVVRRHT